MRRTARTRKRLLAVASGGGHWVQLLRLRPAFGGCDVSYLTTSGGYQRDVVGARVFVVNDASRWNKIALGVMTMRVAWVLLRERPNVIVTTGAAPGYVALKIGKMMGARTVWIDSIANADELSMGGRMAGKLGGLWLTQWEHLASDDGPKYAGAVV